MLKSRSRKVSTSKFALVFLSIVGVVQIVMILVGSQRTGISWDETFHINDFLGPDNVEGLDSASLGLYGHSFQLLGFLISSISTGESLDSVSYTVESLYARHLASATLTIICAAAVARMVWQLRRSAFLSLWAATTLMAVPVFSGHGMFNPKDIPVAAGYTLVTAGCLSALVRVFLPSKSISSGVIDSLVISFGMWIAIGTRYIFGVSILVSLFFTLFILLLAVGRFSATPKSILSVVLGSLGGLLAVWLTNPCLLGRTSDAPCSFASLLGNVLAPSRQVAQGIPMFAWGYSYPQSDKPLWGLPLYIFNGTPLLIFLLVVIGFLVVAVLVTRFSGELIRGRARTTPLFWVLTLVPLVLQAAFTPVVTAIANGAVYDAQRQHLYVYPALITIAAFGVSCAWAWVSRTFHPHQALRASLKGLMLIAVILPTVEGLRLFPFNYVYVNPMVRGGSAEENWETDYWALSFREAVQYASPEPKIEVLGPSDSASLFFERPHAEEFQRYSPLPGERIRIQLRRQSFGWDKFPPYCRVLHEVDRPLGNESVTMSYVLACSRAHN